MGHALHPPVLVTVSHQAGIGKSMEPPTHMAGCGVLCQSQEHMVEMRWNQAAKRGDNVRLK